MLEISYHRIERGVPYQDLGADYLKRHNPKARIRYLTRALEKLNVRATVEPVKEAA